MSLDKKLEDSSFHIINFSLCDVRLINNKNYPWFMLIPRVENITEIFELTRDQQMQLMHEIAHLSRVIQAHFKPDKLNVGALGNIVSQLHVHVITRFKTDALWPHSVWQENLKNTPYTESEKESLIATLRELF